MTDTRDLRDPEKFGLVYLAARASGASIEQAVVMGGEHYDDGGYMSSRPEAHHSQTVQDGEAS